MGRPLDYLSFNLKDRGGYAGDFPFFLDFEYPTLGDSGSLTQGL